MKNRFKLMVLFAVAIMVLSTLGMGSISRAEADVDTEETSTPTPEKTKITKLTSTKDSITVKWDKKKGVDGYEIEYSTKKNRDDSKYITIKSAKTGSKKITKLKPGTTYYISICSYIDDGEGKEYSKDSAVKKITTKGKAETKEVSKSETKTTSKTTTTTTKSTTPTTSSSDGDVWIPKSGKKYHSKSSCSGMSNPTKISRAKAESMGYTPCKKCH